MTAGNGQELPITHIGNGELCTSSHNFKLDGILRVRGEQNVTGANPTDRCRRHCLDTSVDRMSRGRRSKGEACSDVGTVRSPELEIRN